MDEAVKAQREFTRQENNKLGAFLDIPSKELVGWSRSYKCDCGFSCRSPKDIWNHVHDNHK